MNKSMHYCGVVGSRHDLRCSTLAHFCTAGVRLTCILLRLVCCKWPVVRNRGVKLRFSKEPESYGSSNKESYDAYNSKDDNTEGYLVDGGCDPSRGPHGKRPYHRE